MDAGQHMESGQHMDDFASELSQYFPPGTSQQEMIGEN